MSQENIIEVWNAVLEILEKQISESTLTTWIHPLEPQYYDETSFVLHTGQAFAVNLLRKNHYNEIAQAVKSVTQKDLEIKIIFDEELAKKYLKNQKQNQQHYKTKNSPKNSSMTALHKCSHQI